MLEAKRNQVVLRDELEYGAWILQYGICSKVFAVIKDKEQIRGPQCKKTVISWVRNTSVYRRFGGLVRGTKYCILGNI